MDTSTVNNDKGKFSNFIRETFIQIFKMPPLVMCRPPGGDL